MLCKTQPDNEWKNNVRDENCSQQILYDKSINSQDVSGKTCPIFSLCILEKGDLYAAHCREHLQSNKKGMALKGFASSTLDIVISAAHISSVVDFCIRDFWRGL